MNYLNDTTWRKVQEYLPIKNRLNNDIMPKEYFVIIDNINIHIDHYVIENPKATIVLFHGVGGNGRLLSFIAVPLCRQGYEVICPDLPLYGYMEYSGTISYDTWVEYGTKLVKRYQKNKLSMFVFGLSAGGMLAYQVAGECDNISGIVATCILDQRNPMVTNKTASNPLVAKVGKGFINVFHKLLGKWKLPMKMVSNMKAIVNNEELADILMKDKKSSGAKVSIEFLYTMLSPNIRLEAWQFDKCPFLLVHPENDKWTDVSLSRLFFDELACTKELNMLEGAGHFPIEPKGLYQLEEYCLDFFERYRI